MKKHFLILCALCAFSIKTIYADASRSPMAWSSVHTNQITQWKTLNHAPNGVVIDKTNHSVRFLVEATGTAKNEPIEFLAIGPLSDRAYESICVTVASPETIANACNQAGIPNGVACDNAKSRLWPQGEKVQIKVRAWDDTNAFNKAWSDLNLLLKDTRLADEGEILSNPVLYTGGARDIQGIPLASTNIPCAVFALYNHGPSLLQMDGVYDQSSIYGRFQSARSFEVGDLFEILISWDGKTRVRNEEVFLSATNGSEKISLLRNLANKFDVYAQIRFDSSVTVALASQYAKAFAMLDGSNIKMNGTSGDSFFYRAFLPDEKWRTRESRLFQPFEIWVNPDGSKQFTFVEEDWSGEGLDPILKPHNTVLKSWNELPALIANTGDQGSKVNVVFIMAPSNTAVTELEPIVKVLKSRITTFYIFGL